MSARYGSIPQYREHVETAIKCQERICHVVPSQRVIAEAFM
jgi:hypothetical protein